ncbi:hypothetical protein RAS2_34360 [Phycisphaerae bacterium RAS2]|nr:hypothetical protein RAS2_34360 [Phycisphaerae bacterium RAS2]
MRSRFCLLAGCPVHGNSPHHPIRHTTRSRRAGKTRQAGAVTTYQEAAATPFKRVVSPSPAGLASAGRVKNQSTRRATPPPLVENSQGCRRASHSVSNRSHLAFPLGHGRSAPVPPAWPGRIGIARSRWFCIAHPRHCCMAHSRNTTQVSVSVERGSTGVSPVNITLLPVQLLEAMAPSVDSPPPHHCNRLSRAFDKQRHASSPGGRTHVAAGFSRRTKVHPIDLVRRTNEDEL